MSLIRFQRILCYSKVLFSKFSNAQKSKKGDLIFRGKQFCTKAELFGPPHLYFNFKSFKDLNSLSFIRFKCILYDSGELFSDISNFYKLKRADLISLGEPILENGWIIWSPFLYLNFKIFKYPDSFTVIRFQCILHDWGVLFLECWKFYKLNSGT